MAKATTATETTTETTTAEVKTEMKKDKAYYEELVPICLIRDNGKYKDDVTVTLNGVNYQIKRGVKVEVPRKVALVLEQSSMQEANAQQMIEKLSK